MGRSTWVSRNKVLSADMVTMTSSVNAPATVLNLLAREQTRADTWGRERAEPLRQVVKGKAYLVSPL